MHSRPPIHFSSSDQLHVATIASKSMSSSSSDSCTRRTTTSRRPSRGYALGSACCFLALRPRDMTRSRSRMSRYVRTVPLELRRIHALTVVREDVAVCAPIALGAARRVRQAQHRAAALAEVMGPGLLELGV